MSKTESPGAGAIYRYFRSKEEIIGAISEANRQGELDLAVPRRRAVAAVLRGRHQRGVTHLAFCAAGERLASLGAALAQP